MADKTLLNRLKTLSTQGVGKAIANARKNFVAMLSTLTGNEEIKEKDVFTRTYTNHGPRLRRTGASFASLASQNKDRLVTRLGAKHLGSMVMFAYDPKYKDTLPYYDMLPLILPLEFLPNGRMLGLNLHYLPPKLRAVLLDELIEKALKPKFLDERKRIQFSYEIMKRAVSTGAFAPCVKKYIVSPAHVKSRFLIVPPEQWAEVLFLPFERFEKASKQHVYRESMKAMRRR